MLKNILKVTSLTAGLIVPGVAAAATAYVTTDLNIRTGPGVSYQRFGTIPDGSRVTVQSCARGDNWCRVRWAGRTGWVSENYLAYNRPRQPQFGVSVSPPYFGFRFGEPGYFDRDDRRDRARIRRERQDVREARQDVREARRDLRQARRSGENLRDERRQLRLALRDLRREQRQLIRAQRQL